LIDVYTYNKRRRFIKENIMFTAAREQALEILRIVNMNLSREDVISLLRSELTIVGLEAANQVTTEQLRTIRGDSNVLSN
jgi:hypothetical protein